jgi:alpha-tubulin suppressor-like RCC1 family protein
VGSDIEVLERVDVNDFLKCTNVTGSNKPAGTSFLARAIQKLFRPSTLYAAHGGLGGKVKSFSPFGAVQLTETSGLRFSSVSAGEGSTCGLSTIGRAYCWGRGIANSSTSSTTPVAVGTQVYTEITASRDHVCAIASVNLLFCWGQNVFGQVGDGTTNSAPNPVSVFAARGSAKGLSSDHTCALDVQLRAFCWGRNNVGQLGIGSVDGNAHTRPEAVLIANGSPTTWTNLSVGPNHTCGASGTFVFCWGANSDGKLGDGTAIDRSAPTKVQTNVDFSIVSVGDLFTCALTPAGQAYCWGQNTRGELGTGGTVQSQFTPVPVAGGLTFRTISAGRGHACGITPANKAYCWGTNSFGELGDLTSIDRPVPTAVAGNLLFESISVGGTHTCARDTSISGIIYCWGNNSEGEVGDGTTLNHNIPIRIIGQ